MKIVPENSIDSNSLSSNLPQLQLCCKSMEYENLKSICILFVIIHTYFVIGVNPKKMKPKCDIEVQK